MCTHPCVLRSAVNNKRICYVMRCRQIVTLRCVRVVVRQRVAVAPLSEDWVKLLSTKLTTSYRHWRRLCARWSLTTPFSIDVSHPTAAHSNHGFIAVCPFSCVNKLELFVSAQKARHSDNLLWTKNFAWHSIGFNFIGFMIHILHVLFSVFIIS